MRDVAAYLVLVFGLSVIWYVPIINGHGLSQGFGYVAALMWSPAIAAVATQLIFRRTVSGLGWQWPSLRWIGFGYFLPIAYSIVAYGSVWLTGFGKLDLANAPPKMTVFVGLGTLVSLATATGEEIGWRGFLVPALARRLSFAQVGFVSGLIWAVWHLPLVVFSDYNAGTPVWYGVLCFTIGVVAMSFFMAWLRLRARSFWPTAFLHASHNLYVQGFFDRVTVDTGVTRWLTGEFGAVFVAAVVLTALVVATRRRDPEIR